MKNIFLIVVFLLSGCVQRDLIIESHPPGARVFLDSIPMGYTPLTVSFAHYGTRQVVFEKISYHKETQVIKLEKPWYQWPLIDFFSDIIWPGTIEDTHRIHVSLRPLALEDQGLKERAEKAKEELKKILP